jgi:hypothetical protein
MGKFIELLRHDWFSAYRADPAGAGGLITS